MLSWTILDDCLIGGVKESHSVPLCVTWPFESGFAVALACRYRL